MCQQLECLSLLHQAARLVLHQELTQHWGHSQTGWDQDNLNTPKYVLFMHIIHMVVIIGSAKLKLTALLKQNITIFAVNNLTCQVLVYLM